MVRLVERGLLVPARVAAVAESVLAESLANVRKHSHANAAVVSCSVLGELLALSVTDDGVGMPDETGRPAGEGDLHFGISNLRTMVERAGGAFAVLSCEEGTGTVVRARIPLTGELIAAGTVG